MAHRYIYRSDLWVVSLESTYILEYGNKKTFRISFFYREFSRFKIREHSTVLFTFSVILAKIWLSFANIIENMLKFLMIECYCFHWWYKNVNELFAWSFFG